MLTGITQSYGHNLISGAQNGKLLPPDSKPIGQGQDITARPENSLADHRATIGSENTLRDVAAKYDVINISLNEKVALGKELFDMGKISPLELAVFTVADIPSDGSAINPDQRSNLIERFEFSAKYGRSENTMEANEAVNHLLSISNMLAEIKNEKALDLFT